MAAGAVTGSGSQTAIRWFNPRHLHPPPNYAAYVNPQWQRLLSVLGMNVHYDRCFGAELFTSDGRRIVDFLSGYCVHNAGHNHPEIIAAVKAELDRCGPAMLQSHVPELAGELAARLCQRAGGKLSKSSFAVPAAKAWRPRLSSPAQGPAAPACFTTTEPFMA